ncbi:uncharacterized protein LOC127031398 isoform X2 [Gopherus flavomarginatus]|uniref:uncharacterized protein LOC127031398 isoform X2 n=1 Tax=Gopherus flavomarginatus TaxID=286002 RepID=UPI0021CC3DBD|nr:uncharacterized protein LOC127031398 isoform X2 [Gopherus flavomarginatus]
MGSGRGAALWSLLLSFAFLLVLGRAKIQQPWSSEVLDGDELNLTCSHHAAKGSDSTIWYQQLPNPIPQFALTGYKETINSPEPKGALYISADKVSSTLALHRSRQIKHKEIFLHTTHSQPLPEDVVKDKTITGVNKELGASGRAEILQPRSAEHSEGAELNLTCSHGSITSETIFWYRQFPNRGPQYIVSGYREIVNSINPEGALHISEDRKSSTLSLRRARLADAAVYYCALSDTV